MKFAESGNFDDISFDINLTPLIDIVFLLLIFFMVSTTFVETQGIQVNLPEASQKMLQEKPKNIVVTLTAEGETFLGEKKTSISALEQMIKRQAAETTLVIRADKSVSHGKVVQIMDLAHSHGLQKIAIATAVRKK